MTSTVLMACSMAEARRLGCLACLVGAAALALAAVGCGESGSADFDGTRVLSKKETVQLLRRLPYHYEFRPVATPKDADAAVAGRAVGPHRTVVNFGIALGRGYYGVPVPGAGISEVYGYTRGGFIFTDDLRVKGPDGRFEANPHLHTAAQWRESGHMDVEMTDKLCLAATGEHCPP
jgi:hypothetical protein